MLPEEIRRRHRPVRFEPLASHGEGGRPREAAIEARGLTRRFGDFVAVDHVDMRIGRGEIFGFLGSNGCGKTTTMKMIAGLLPASGGEAWIFGRPVDARDIAARRRVGYMSQSFSLAPDLTVRETLMLHAQLFDVPARERRPRIEAVAARFGLGEFMDSLPDGLPLGVRQRLSLAVATVHEPELLILDEPTSGVDPVARDGFWNLLIELSRRDGVTIFISTHFMNEAQRCDRISFMHAGRVLDMGAPDELMRRHGAQTLEDAFIACLLEAGAGASAVGEGASDGAIAAASVAANSIAAGGAARSSIHRGFSLRRAASYTVREILELRRDPVRAVMALLGSLILMTVIGFGISMDVEDLRYAVLDHDGTVLSRDYALSLDGSRYFTEMAPISDHEELDRRMRRGEISLALEIPPGFARDLERGDTVQIGAWVDGAMPQRGETVRGYVSGMHRHWLADLATRHGMQLSANAGIETRFRYNPDVRSLPAIVPAVIPMLLLVFPAMLAALAVVREKELGSIMNFRVTPVTRSEFLLGKQAPYIGLGLLNFLLMTLLAVAAFGVPLKGSFWTLAIASLVFVAFATGFGLLISTFVRSQIAAIFATLLATIIPMSQYSGLLHPVSSLEGVGRAIGEIYPGAFMILVSRGVFSKALDLVDLRHAILAMTPAPFVVMALAIALLRKQER